MFKPRYSTWTQVVACGLLLLVDHSSAQSRKTKLRVYSEEIQCYSCRSSECWDCVDKEYHEYFCPEQWDRDVEYDFQNCTGSHGCLKTVTNYNGKIYFITMLLAHLCRLGHLIHWSHYNAIITGYTLVDRRCVNAEVYEELLYSASCVESTTGEQDEPVTIKQCYCSDHFCNYGYRRLPNYWLYLVLFLSPILGRLLFNWSLALVLM